MHKDWITLDLTRGKRNSAIGVGPNWITWPEPRRLGDLPGRAPNAATLDNEEPKGWSIRSHATRRSGRQHGVQPSDATCTISDLVTLANSGRRYGCVCADPPWRYKNRATRGAAINHYESMTIDAICALPVAQLAAPDAHLHLWVTYPLVFEAERVLNAWGFDYRSMFVWAKPRLGLGNYWRGSHEILLTAVRGNKKRFQDKALRSWKEIRGGEHSAKPAEVRSMLERASPGPYLELFGRQPVTGWTVWGNQIKREELFPGSLS